MQAQQARLQIATKIHYFLLRELDHGIDIERMLTQERYARDVLLVCEACKGTELALLAQQYRHAMPYVARPAPGEAAGGHTPDSAFPASEPAPLGEAPPPGPARRSWFARLMR